MELVSMKRFVNAVMRWKVQYVSLLSGGIFPYRSCGNGFAYHSFVGRSLLLYASWDAKLLQICSLIVKLMV
jgi:hypothetical protein